MCEEEEQVEEGGGGAGGGAGKNVRIFPPVSQRRGPAFSPAGDISVRVRE